MLSRKDFALCFGLASSICITGMIGMAVYYNTNSIKVFFPFGEQYIEFALGVLSIIIIGYELFFGDR